MSEKDSLIDALNKLAAGPKSDQESPKNEREKDFEKIEALIADTKKQFLADEKLDLRHAVGSIAEGLTELISSDGDSKKKEGKKTEGDQDKEDPLDPESKKNKEQVKNTTKEHRKGLVLVLQGGDDDKSGE